MDFFAGRRPADEDVPDYRVPGWYRPPEDEVPVRLPGGAAELYRDAGTVLMLQGITAYSTGCQLDVLVALRRGDRDAASWDRATDSAYGGRFGEDAGELRFGVALLDGRTATTLDALDDRDDDEVTGPVLLACGAHGSGGRGRSYRSEQEYWLWPLPSPEPFTLVWAWPAAGVPEGRRVLDGAPIVEAAAAVTPLWPEG